MEKDYPKAESYYKRALTVMEISAGPNHPEVAGILENYGLLLQKMNRNEEADKMLERAKTIRSKSEPKKPDA